MSSEARKLFLIEAILKMEDEVTLAKIENLLNPLPKEADGKKSPADFAGIWTEEEAEEFKKIIEESCEQIHPDDWK